MNFGHLDPTYMYAHSGIETVTLSMMMNSHEIV